MKEESLTEELNLLLPKNREGLRLQSFSNDDIKRITINSKENHNNLVYAKTQKYVLLFKYIALPLFRRKVSMAQVWTDNDWVKIDASLYTSVAIKKDGTTWLWGENKNDQLGLNTWLEIVSEPMLLN